MRVFVSAGEPSGDIHGANLVRELQRIRPDAHCVGFGGDAMRAAGCDLLYPLCDLAVMWFARVLANAPTFLGILSRADRYFRHQRPDAVVLIDYPGLHWWLARRAHFHGIPVFYFVPPQLWSWGGWRVKKMQRFVDHVLCTLPFEKPWYEARGVAAHYVGHPFFDEVPRQQLDHTFLAEQESQPGRIVGILPGSRKQEIECNLSTQIRAARRVLAAVPQTRFLVACFRKEHKDIIDDYLQRDPPLPIETHVGRTPEIIELSHACLSVSGSVSLELLYRTKPTVIAYRIGKIDLKVCRWFLTTPFITLVNLLAEREVYPEFLTDRCQAEEIAGHLICWLKGDSVHARLREELAALKEKVAEPGACRRAAQYVLEQLHRRRAA
ncbi:MAG: lipid-A-disaccharide synthase [Gemmataceae bacterium]|nr:lipid-A-disaccharide synthase [Gemmataceae bacterium]